MKEVMSQQINCKTLIEVHDPTYINSTCTISVVSVSANCPGMIIEKQKGSAVFYKLPPTLPYFWWWQHVIVFSWKRILFAGISEPH